MSEKLKLGLNHILNDKISIRSEEALDILKGVGTTLYSINRTNKHLGIPLWEGDGALCLHLNKIVKKGIDSAVLPSDTAMLVATYAHTLSIVESELVRDFIVNGKLECFTENDHRQKKNQAEEVYALQSGCIKEQSKLIGEKLKAYECVYPNDDFPSPVTPENRQRRVQAMLAK